MYKNTHEHCKIQKNPKTKCNLNCLYISQNSFRYISVNHLLSKQSIINPYYQCSIYLKTVMTFLYEQLNMHSL